MNHKDGEERTKGKVADGHFRHPWQFRLFIAIILAGQAVNLMPFGATISSQNILAEYLGVADDQGQIIWLVSAYSLTAAAFVLIGGQLCDLYGGRIVWQSAMAWQFVWNLIGSFAKSVIFFDICRGMAGVGCGLLLPAGISLLATYHPPGRQRALLFGLFGALAPFSAAGGSIFETMLAQLASPPWMWRLLALKHALLVLLSLFCMSSKMNVKSKDKPDYVGSTLGVAGLFLFCFSFIQAILFSWKSATAIASLIAGAVALLVFSVWEIKFARNPVLPFSIWSVPTFPFVLLAAFCGFTSFGIFVVYTEQFFLHIRHSSALLSQAYFTPFTLGAFAAAILSGLLTRVISAQWIMITGLVCLAVSNTLMATCPPSSTYWTHAFFSLCFTAFGPDFLFTAVQLIASNTANAAQQGVAASLVGTALNFGLAWGAALGGTADVQVRARRAAEDEDQAAVALHGIRAAFYLGIGLSVFGAILVALFVRVAKDEREQYDDAEKEVTANAQHQSHSSTLEQGLGAATETEIPNGRLGARVDFISDDGPTSGSARE